MRKSGLNWKWPKYDDKRFYSYKFIKKKIVPPKQLNRGVLQVLEMCGRW